MDPHGVMLFFTILGVTGIAGILTTGIGATRFVRDGISRTDVDTVTRIRCCGVDLSIFLAGSGLMAFTVFNVVRVALI